MKAMEAKRMGVTLGYLPCVAGAIPLAYRNLKVAEREGLVRYGTEFVYVTKFVWKLTPKGEEFLQRQMKKLRPSSIHQRTRP